MKLYDTLIASSLTKLGAFPGRRLPVSGPGDAWQNAGDHSLILRSDMAYELGGGALPAVSGLGFTSSRSLVDEDELWLYGPDLSELKEDAPFVRLTFLRVAEYGLGEANAAYSAIRKIEYTRYRISPKGYMMRISAASERETARVGREALRDGLDFSKVGGYFIAGYRRHPAVLAAKVIFVTLPGFPYGELEKQARQAEAITGSLDNIFRNLKMDCSVCNLKPVCDEVEGLRELHFSQGTKQE